MADITFPTLSRESVRVHRQVPVGPAQSYRSPFDGTLQTGSSQGPRWQCSLELRPMTEADAVEIQAFVMKLRGQANRALLPYFARKVPRGTISLSGVTVNGALAQGASQVTLAGAGNAKTLLTGDLMKLGDQVVMVVDGPYTSDAAGAMASVKFEYPLRAAVAHGAGVTLDTPTARYILRNAESGWETRQPVITEIMGLEFEEDFS